MRNSDPRVRMVLCFKDSILISTPYLPCKCLVATSNPGPILVFPWIQHFGCDASSSLGRVYSRLATARNWENSAMSFVMKYCPTSTTFSNPASMQNLLNLSCCDNFLIRSPYCCNRRSFRAKSSPSQGTSVLITLGTNEELVAFRQRVAPIHRERFRILHTCLRLLRKDWTNWQK